MSQSTARARVRNHAQNRFLHHQKHGVVIPFLLYCFYWPRISACMFRATPRWVSELISPKELSRLFDVGESPVGERRVSRRPNDDEFC